MTNIKSVAGAAVWAAFATLLMLATFEPVPTEAPGLSPNGTIAILA